MDNRIQIINKILTDTNQPAYRVRQVIHSIYSENVSSYQEISSLPKELRTKLIETLGEKILSLENIHEKNSKQVRKILFKTQDGHRIESVFMTYLANEKRAHDYNSICVSSQSGCALNCSFCSTGAIGFKKNLTADEITDQILYFKQEHLPIHSISFMGMGEPLANPNLFEALDLITDKDKVGLGQRKINISTVGIIPGIEKLTQKYPNINLAFSLHSPIPSQRTELMPINKTYPIQDVMTTLNSHISETNRKVFIAYILLNNVNDTEAHANELIKLIKKQNHRSYYYHVNLIRFNPGVEFGKYTRSSKETTYRFSAILSKAKIQNTIRHSFGEEIDAACGQLYGEYENKIEKPN